VPSVLLSSAPARAVLAAGGQAPASEVSAAAGRALSVGGTQAGTGSNSGSLRLPLAAARSRVTSAPTEGALGGCGDGLGRAAARRDAPAANQPLRAGQTHKLGPTQGQLQVESSAAFWYQVVMV
jgi:hypothetical protein